jgi:hypothetical protein
MGPSKPREHSEPARERPPLTLRVHPMLNELTRRGGDRPGTVMLVGYAGEASEPGKVRLYLSLSDLSLYLEFAEDSVLNTHETNSGGVVVWVGAHESVTAVHTRIFSGSARDVAGAIARWPIFWRG